MLGSELRRQEHEVSRSLAHCSPFLRATDPRRRVHLPVFPAWSRRLEAVFRSPRTVFWGHCSRPASSTPRWAFIRTVRPVAPSLMPVSPDTSEINTSCPFPDCGPAIPILPRTHSLLGLSSRQINAIRFVNGWFTIPRRPDFFLLPAPFNCSAARHLKSATAAVARCSSNYLEPV